MISKMNLRKAFGFFIVMAFSSSSMSQYTNIRVSEPGSTTPNEVTIAINPADPLNLAAGANLDFYYYSKDGGMTWTEGRMHSLHGVWGDPCVTFDLEGNLYYGHLSDPVTGYWIDRIVVQKSTDGGESWNHGAGVGFFYPKNQDKEWLIADLTDSQYSNNIYMAWTEFDGYASTYPQDSTRIRFSRSTDFGETWSTSLRVSDVGGDCLDGDNTVEGAVPAVGPDGEVYLSWAGPLGIMFDKSMDGGVTFGKDTFVTSQPGGWNFFVMGLQRCNGFPVTVCDISDSPYRGTIYILFSDQRNGTMDTDVFLVKSLDRGETWSSPKRVNDDDSGRHQFFPWMAVDPFTGYIYVVFYDQRETTGEHTDVYMATSYDGGETFDNFKISESPFRPVHSVFLGDYINITAWNGMVYPIWVRMDYFDRSVWCAVIQDTIATALHEGVNTIHSFELFQNFPNPFNAETSISFEMERPGKVQVSVYNPTGQLVEILVNSTFSSGRHTIIWDAGDLVSGLYFYRIRAGGYTTMKKCLLIK